MAFEVRMAGTTTLAEVNADDFYVDAQGVTFRKKVGEDTIEQEDRDDITWPVYQNVAWWPLHQVGSIEKLQPE